MKRIVLVLLIACLPLTPAWGADSADSDEPASAGIEGKVLDLETAQRTALQGNPGIGTAQARIEQAKAGVKQAMAADRPTVDVSGSVGASGDTDDISENSSVGLQASWLLFDGYAKQFRQEQAQYRKESSVAAKLNDQRLLISAVAAAFFNAQLAQTSVEIAAADQGYYQQQLTDAEHRFEAGAGPKGDVLNMKVQLNSAKNGVLAAERDYEAARYGLAALLGLPDTVKLEKLDRDYILPDDDLGNDVTALIEEALRTRPDFNQRGLGIKSAKAAIGQAEARNWPTVQLGGQVGAAAREEFFPSDDDINGSLSLSLSWNLYSGGAVEAAVVEARQAKRAAVYDHADLRNNIASEIRQDIAQLEAARKQVHLQRETVDLVKENRDLAENEYEAGAASLVRLNEAQRDLTATYGRLAQALVGYHQARQKLLAAVGRNFKPFKDLLEADIPEPDSIE